jgi:RimJ/RimL family protein N-acetyltransferase
MYSFNLTRNANLVFEAYSSENNKKWCFHQEFDLSNGITLNKECLFVEVRFDGKYLGCFTLSPVNESTFEIHTTLLPVAYGSAIKIGSELISWIKGNLQIEKLKTLCSTQNTLICRLATKNGFIKTVKSDKTWNIDGVVHVFDEYELKL